MARRRTSCSPRTALRRGESGVDNARCGREGRAYAYAYAGRRGAGPAARVAPYARRVQPWWWPVVCAERRPSRTADAQLSAATCRCVRCARSGTVAGGAVRCVLRARSVGPRRNWELNDGEY